MLANVPCVLGSGMVVLMHNSTSSVVNGFGSVLAPICASLVGPVLLDDLGKAGCGYAAVRFHRLGRPGGCGLPDLAA